MSALVALRALPALAAPLALVRQRRWRRGATQGAREHGGEPEPVLAGQRVSRRAIRARIRQGDDLRGVDLRRTDLSGLDLSRIALSGRDLSGAYLRRSSLAGCELVRTNLSFADLSGADLAGCDLTGACLLDADLTGASLVGANLRFAREVGVAALRGATYDRDTTWPSSVDPRRHGVRWVGTGVAPPPSSSSTWARYVADAVDPEPGSSPHTDGSEADEPWLPPRSDRRSEQSGLLLGVADDRERKRCEVGDDGGHLGVERSSEHR